MGELRGRQMAAGAPRDAPGRMPPPARRFFVFAASAGAGPAGGEKTRAGGKAMRLARLREWGLDVCEILACCGAEDHTSHPACTPGWEEDLPPGSTVLVGPVYKDGRWVALVAVPTRGPSRRRGRVRAE